LTEFAGKKVLVTGSSRGIGLEIAAKFASAGATIALNGRDAEMLDVAASSLGPSPSVAIVGDVSDPAQANAVLADAASRLGGLDCVVCNVGSGASVPPGNETPDEWHRVFAVNLWSATNTVAAATPYLEQTGGSIVCISSICGVQTIPGAPVTYSAAKSALNAFVAGISRPLGAKGIRINAVAPGNIVFDGSVWQRKLREDAAAVEAMLVRDVPLRRLGTPQDVAELVLYLSSPRASFATGQVWTLDGGQVRA
jgi:3-oxoacyl-[acyl-carrier protein] reductase